MKKIWMLIFVLLLFGCSQQADVAVYTTAGGQAEQGLSAGDYPEQGTPVTLSEPENRYKEWVMELDSVQAIFDAASYKSGIGEISLIYLSEVCEWLPDLTAVYRADFDAGEMKRLETVFRTDEVVWQYEYIDGGDFEYIRYQNNIGEKETVPLYVNCNHTLRYSCPEEMAVPVCDWEEVVPELIFRNGSLYQIDRKTGQINETMADINWSIYEWLSGEMRREIEIEQAKQDISQEQLESIIPEGYLLLFDHYASADFNQDGYADFIMCLYPANITEDMYTPLGGDRSWHIPEYQCSSFWVFWGSETGNYQEVQGPGIDWGYLTLTDINAYDGGFQLEYFSGKSPFENEVFRYEYDLDKAVFYTRENVSRDRAGVTIRHLDNIGEQIFYVSKHILVNHEEKLEGFSERERIRIEIPGVRDRTEDAGIKDKDKQKESTVNGLIDEARLEMSDILAADEGDKSGYIRNIIFYESPLILSSQILFSGKIGGEHRDLALSYTIDRNTCERIQIKDYLTYDQMAELLRTNKANVHESDESAFAKYLQSDDEMAKLWADLNNGVVLVDGGYNYVTLDFLAEGLRLQICDQSINNHDLQIWIGKEEFRNTGLYKFWQ